MACNASNLAAVAFDLDDTLFDRAAAVRAMLESWLENPPPAVMAAILERDANGHSPRGPFFHWLARRHPELGEDGPELWMRFRTELPAWITPDPAARDILTHLAAAGLRTGVLTDGHSAGQRAKLRALGLEPRFEPGRVLVTSELPAEKPDARAFDALVAALGVPAESILFVGDHPDKDMAGARHCGLKTCWLRRRQPGATCPAADLVIDSLGDLIPHLRPRQ